MRRNMRHLGGSLAALAITASSSFGQQAGKPPVQAGAARPAPAVKAVQQPKAPVPEDPQAVAKMEAILKKWEAKSATVSKLDVIFTRIDKDRDWDETTYEGRAVLQSPNLAWFDLQKVKVDANGKVLLDAAGKKQLERHERLICTGKEVWQYRPAIKQIIIHPLAVEERQRALEEGPLPFLFNMKADQAKKRYKMVLTSETPEVYVIKILPLLAIDLESFELAYAQLDKVTLQPRQLRLVDKARDTKDYWFTKMESNPTTDLSKFFVGEKYAGWTVEVNDGKPKPGAAQPAQVGQLPPAQPRQPIGMPKGRRQ